MTENHRAPRVYKIYVSIIVFVIQICTLGALHKDGVATHGAKCPYRRVYTTGNKLLALSNRAVLRVV